MYSRNPSSERTIRRSILCITLVLFAPSHAFSQETEADPPEQGSATEPTSLSSITNDLAMPESGQSSVANTGIWSTRVDSLIEGIIELKKTAADADSLYLELDRVLRARLDRLNSSLKGAKTPLDKVVTEGLPKEIRTIDDLHASVEAMYSARLRLIKYLTPTLHLETTATDAFALQQLSLEFNFILEQIRFRAINIPAATGQLWRRIQIAPLPRIGHLLEFILAIALFRWWRRWLPETLRRMNVSLAEIRPRTSVVLERITIIWYIGQLRRPLEWLLLFHVLFGMVDLPGLNLIRDIVAVIVRWILLGWFSVALLNAIAARGDAGLAGENAGLRLRSLGLVTGWLVLLGLGLGLAEQLAGVASLHAWVWRLYTILAFPVLFILLAWWRKPIHDRLEREDENIEAVAGMLKRKKGLRSYSSAASGIVWLLANSLRRRVMQSFLRISDDPGVITSLSTGQTDSSIEKDADEQVNALPDAVRKNILTRVEFYERYARSERRKIIRRSKKKQGGLVAISGERGIGKSSFLESIRTQSEESMILLDCKFGKYEELVQSLGHALSITTVDAESVSQALAGSNIRIIAIDNVHHLIRPIMGGQVEFTRMSELFQNIRNDVLWVASADRFAWQYLRRARADQSGVNEMIELPPWTEDQIAGLLDQRNNEAGIEPNFRTAHVPNEYVDTTLDSTEARNKAGIYRMITSMSAGNPSIALRILADSLRPSDSGGLHIQMPVQPAARELERVSGNVLLVLRAIAQFEFISKEDVVDHLRLTPGAVGRAVYFAMSCGWVEENNGRYRISWTWYRTITRVLGRQNLLTL